MDITFTRSLDTFNALFRSPAVDRTAELPTRLDELKEILVTTGHDSKLIVFGRRGAGRLPLCLNRAA